jgi:hypothetical protein
MKHICLVDLKILATDLSLSVHASLTCILFMIVRPMPYVTIWVLFLWVEIFLFDAGQNLGFLLVRIAIAPGKKNRSLLRNDEQHGTLKHIICLLTTSNSLTDHHPTARWF